MTYDPIDTSASDDTADSSATIDKIDATVLQGLNLDEAPAGLPVSIGEENGQTVFTAVPPSGIAYWTFDNADTSGTTAIDIWNGNNGTIDGATTGVSGANEEYTTNEAYDFDGNFDGVDTGIQSLTTPFTVAMWAFPDNNDGIKSPIFENFNSTSDDLFFNAEYRQNVDGWTVALDAGGGQVRPLGSVDQNTWQHVVAVFGGTSVGHELYKNGALIGSASGVDTTVDNGFNFQIGREVRDRAFPGKLDDVRIYDKALSSTEVSNLYLNGKI